MSVELVYVSAKMNKMPAAGENGIENELLLEALTPAEVAAVRGLFLLNLSNLPEFLSQRCNLTLLSSDSGLFKYCSAADVDDHQQRFLISVAHARDHILPYLLPGQHPMEGVPIRVYLEDGTYYPLLFKQRRCDNKYVITHRGSPEIRRWSHVCYAMGLQQGDGVRMWIYRHLGSHELCISTAKQVREGGLLVMWFIKFSHP